MHASHSGPRRSAGAGEDELREPAFPCLTYANVLLEQPTEGTWVVYLPQYGFDPLDRAARRTWEGLGCRVVAVEGLAASAMCGGSLRCCVKVLERSPGPQAPRGSAER